MIKVYLRCQSLTLNASLQRMLKDFLVPEQEAQFIITDHHIKADKPYLYISREQDADIVKPFTNASLLLAPVFGVSQATYFVLLASLSTIRVSQDQDPCFGANFAIKSLLEGAGFLGADSPFDGLEL